MPLPLPILLAVVAGAVDTTSFLSLSGLFAAHITGNLVVLGATLVLGQPRGVWSKLTALPVFVLGVSLASIAVDRFHPRDPQRPLLTAELVLLLGALAVTVARGPFSDADHPWGFAVGMLLVAAMAIQNAFGPLAASDAPPTAVMTSNMTRLFVGLALLLARPAADRQARRAAQRQARELSWQGAGFLLGCAAAALSHVVLRNWALAVPAACLTLVWLLSEYSAALTRRAVPRS
jgi:uncharacterized membrane protein YoaK (UPF0700 family)